MYGPSFVQNDAWEATRQASFFPPFRAIVGPHPHWGKKRGSD